MGLGDLRRTPIGDPEAMRQASGATCPTGSNGELQEMTPTPMVVGAPVESLSSGVVKAKAAASGRLTNGDNAVNAASGFASARSDDAVDGAVLERSSQGESSAMQPEGCCPVEHARANGSYHPPRIPPSSMVPPPAAASFSVASEYDPRAPTKPKLRRNTSAPPPPLLFGLDRMLVWGLVLGGLFVAAIVIIVHQLALTTATQATRSVAGQVDGAAVAEQQSVRQMSGANAEPGDSSEGNAPASIPSVEDRDATVRVARSSEDDKSNDAASKSEPPPLGGASSPTQVTQRVLRKPGGVGRSKAKPNSSAASIPPSPKGTQPWLK